MPGKLEEAEQWASDLDRMAAECESRADQATTTEDRSRLCTAARYLRSLAGVHRQQCLRSQILN